MIPLSIIVEHDDGSCSLVDWDLTTDPEAEWHYNARALYWFHHTQLRAERLVEHGDIYRLSAFIKKTRKHTWDNPVDDQTIYYSRERGDVNRDPRKFPDYQSARASTENLVFAWRGVTWFYDNNVSCLELGTPSAIVPKELF